MSAAPERLSFSPDGSVLTFLKANAAGTSVLHGLDMKTLVRWRQQRICVWARAALTLVPGNA